MWGVGVSKRSQLGILGIVCISGMEDLWTNCSTILSQPTQTHTTFIDLGQYLILSLYQILCIIFAWSQLGSILWGVSNIWTTDNQCKSRKEKLNHSNFRIVNYPYHDQVKFFQLFNYSLHPSFSVLALVASS